jgi:outer membrane protein OmpA-like peptidoglycan-associated protein
VNADRLVTDGMGESQAVVPNDTPANKALNRRVEFIKQ